LILNGRVATNYYNIYNVKYHVRPSLVQILFRGASARHELLVSSACWDVRLVGQLVQNFTCLNLN